MTLALATCLLLTRAALAAPPAPEGLADLIREYSTDRADLRRFYPVEFSPVRLDRFDRFEQEWRSRLHALDFEALDADAKVDYVLLGQQLDYEAKERALLRSRGAAEAALLPCAGELLGLEEARWKLAKIDAAKIAARFAALAGEIDDLAKKTAIEGKTEGAIAVDPVAALRAAGRVDDVGRALDRWFYHYHRFDPQASFWIDAPGERLQSSLRAYAQHLRADVAGKRGAATDPLVGEPIGRDLLLAALDREMIAYSPEELIRIGEREFAWCTERMQEEARSLGFATVAEALDRVKSQYVAPGEQDDLVKAIADEAVALLDAKELVTVPDLCRELWRVDMMPEGNRRVLPFACYGGQCMEVNYASSELDQKEKEERLRGNNVHFTRIVTPHELIPGHHLQGFMSDRFRPERQVFSTPFLGEGWCLYWEIRLLEMGWGKSPEDRLGILFWRRHRAARILVSLKYHLGQMQPPAMIAFLEQETGLEHDGAVGEVRRYLEGGYGPLYQCAYLLGGLQLKALYSELVPAGRMTEKQFHDAVLHENAIPIELIRARLEALPLPRDGKAQWRFAGDLAAAPPAPDPAAPGSAPPAGGR